MLLTIFVGMILAAQGDVSGNSSVSDRAHLDRLAQFYLTEASRTTLRLPAESIADIGECFKRFSERMEEPQRFEGFYIETEFVGAMVQYSFYNYSEILELGVDVEIRFSQLFQCLVRCGLPEKLYQINFME